MTQPSSHLPSAITLETRNFRALHRTCWTPSGVCVVVGPNGAGKTTLLSLLDFLRNAYRQGAASAIHQIGGVYGLRSWGARDDEPVLIASGHLPYTIRRHAGRNTPVTSPMRCWIMPSSAHSGTPGHMGGQGHPCMGLGQARARVLLAVRIPARPLPGIQPGR